jgi:hypothetical protein
MRQQNREGEGATVTPFCDSGGTSAHREKLAVAALSVTVETAAGEALRPQGGGYLHGQRHGEV